jgi:hypothetical protein
MNRLVMLRRKAAKRTLPFDLTAEELLVSQDDDIPAARKKPRLEEPLTTTTDEATKKAASSNVSVGLPPPPAADDDDDLNADAVTDTQPNDGATRATARWTTDEDVQLTSAVTNTSKKKYGKITRQIGMKLPCWFRVEREFTVGRDGTMAWIPASTRRIVVQVNGQKMKTSS